MKNKIKSVLTTLLLCMAITYNVKSQVSITNTAEISKIKNGTTYIVMKDPDAEKSKEYIDVFKNNWNISKIEFIKYSELENYLSPENSYVTIGNLINTSQFVQQMGDGSRRYGTSYSSINIYIKLWTCNEKYFSRNKSKNKFGNADKIQVARMELFTDFKTLTHPGLIYESDYDGDGHIRNWGPGILKNYIQSLMSYLNRADGHWLYSEIQNANEMKQLKNETLYVPDYVLIKFNQFTGDESKKHDESDIFGDYSFKYKIIPTDSLNKKILTEKSAFYYLIYIKSSTDKYVTVINSSTGEIIYSNYTPVSFNIKSGDLKTLRKKIS